MKRWFYIDVKTNGRSYFIGKLQATKDEIVRELGPYVEINEQNGHVLVWGRPR